MAEVAGFVEPVGEQGPREKVAAFFERPAVFASSLSPGYIAGGSQCTLAFLQAISRLHGGRVTYFGPPYLESDLPMEIDVQERIIIGPRSTAEKVWGLARGTHVDRCTPSAARFLSSNCDPGTIVYVNGDAAGRTVLAAKEAGLTSVFICHNFAPEYLGAETRWFDIPRQLYVRVLIQCAFDGYKHSDLRLLLTEEDRRSYAGLLGDAPCLTDVYFGYRGADFSAVTASDVDDASTLFTVLVNTNMALRQNEEGALFVINEVWPRVSANLGWKLVLAGRFPRPSIYKAAAAFDNVEVICHPEAQEMEQIFRRSSVCIAATSKGSGIKLRVAEALRRGLPVVSTEHCLRGYGSLSEEVVRRYETAEELAAHLVDLAQRAPRERRERCLMEYQEHLSFDAGLRKLSRIAEII